MYHAPLTHDEYRTDAMARDVDDVINPACEPVVAIHISTATIPCNGSTLLSTLHAFFRRHKKIVLTPGECKTAFLQQHDALF